jgi:hypothetical protein
MRLFEFAGDIAPGEDDPLAIEITAVVSQIVSRIEDTDSKERMSVKALLNKLDDADINISEEQLRDMIKHEPLSNLIANIQGDKVIFKGQTDEPNDAFEPDASTKTLKKMAKRAEKERD